MQKFLSILLAVCLLVNMSVPSGWAQRRPVDIEANLKALLRDTPLEISDRIEQRKKRIKELEEIVRTTKDKELLEKSLREIDSLRFQNRLDYDILSRDVVTAPRDATYVAPRTLKVLHVEKRDTKQESFMRKVSRNELAFEDLIEYANPITGDDDTSNFDTQEDLRVVTYASEMIGNTLDSLNKENCPPELFEAINDALQSTQVRLLYQLYKMEDYKVKGQTDMYRVLAVGTVRITLLKIKQFYERMEQENPVRFASSEDTFKVQGDENSAAMLSHQNPGICYQVPCSLQVAKPSVEQLQKGLSGLVDEKPNQEIDPYEDAFRMFIKELSARADKKPKEESSDYSSLMVLAETATMYTLLYDPKRLGRIVSIFDEGPKADGDFKQHYSAVLNTIFTNVFETVRYSNLSSEKSLRAMEQLKKFSDPDAYSVPTRVFALEAASLMFRSTNAKYRNDLDLKKSGQTELFPFLINDTFFPQEEFRKLFADRTANLYCPLTTHYRLQYSYGLDSEQMAELAGKLAYIYDGFYDILSEAFSAPGTEDHPHPWTPCQIIGRSENNLNQRKRKNEQDLEILLFMGETILWIYGFQLLRVVGTAYRMTRGAVAVLPRAMGTARAAGSGQRWISFSNVVRQGARGSNVVEGITANGGRVIQTVKAERKVASAAGRTQANASGSASDALVQSTAGSRTQAGGSESLTEALAQSASEQEGTFSQWIHQTTRTEVTPIQLKPIMHTRQLMGKYPVWKGGPLRGRMPEPVNTFVEQTLPDGTVNYFKVPEGFNLHSYQSLGELTSRLEPITPGTSFQQLTLNEWRLVQERQAIQMGMLRGNTMEPYLQLENGKWWNATWGTPTMELASDGPFQTIMLLPRTNRTVLNGLLKSSKPQVHRLLTFEELQSQQAIQTTAVEFMNGSWTNRAIEQYFKPIDWGNPVANYFLPRFIRNKAGWKALANAPLTLSTTMGNILQPGAMQWLFFGGLTAVDKLAYTPFSGFMKNIISDNIEREQKRYGDTFSKEKLDEDAFFNQLNQTDPRARNKMSTYQAVSAAGRQRTNGSSIGLITLGAKYLYSHAIGNGSPDLLNDKIKAQFALSASNLEFNRALREQQQVFLKQQQVLHEEQLASAQHVWEQQLAQQEAEFLQQEQVQMMMLFDPTVKDKIHGAFEKYRQEIVSLSKNAQAGDASLAQKQQQAVERLEKRLDGIMEAAIAKYEQTEQSMYGNLFEEVEKSQESWDEFWTNTVNSFRLQIHGQFPTLVQYTVLNSRLEDAFKVYLQSMSKLYPLPEEKRVPLSAEAEQKLNEEVNAIANELGRMTELLEDYTTPDPAQAY